MRTETLSEKSVTPLRCDGGGAEVEIKSLNRFLKVKEVQALLGVSRSTVWRWHAERGLRVVSVGGVVRIRERDLQEFLDRHAIGKPVSN